MRIGIISDIHANLHGLRAVLGALSEVDAIICAGDLTGYYTRPNEVIAELTDRGVIWIAGNHDMYLRRPPARVNELLSQSIAFTRSVLSSGNARRLARKPCARRVRLDGLRIAIFHGSPWDWTEQYIYQDFSHWERFGKVNADVIVLGHTHRPLLKRVGQRLVINPGSCGQPRDGDARAAYAVLDTRNGSVTFGRAAYDIEALAREITEHGLDGRLISALHRRADRATSAFAVPP